MMTVRKTLTHARSMDLFEYNQSTGVITWKVQQARRCRPGMVAGNVRDDGHITIRIDGKPYQASHIAILMATGKMPVGPVKHLNDDNGDNRIANLSAD